MVIVEDFLQVGQPVGDVRDGDGEVVGVSKETNFRHQPRETTQQDIRDNREEQWGQWTSLSDASEIEAAIPGTIERDVAMVALVEDANKTKNPTR